MIVFFLFCIFFKFPLIYNSKQDQFVAPALQAAQEALKKEKLAQGLAHKLEQRPEKTALVDRNVLKGRKKLV